MANPSIGVYAGSVGTMGPTTRNVNAEDVLDLLSDISPWETPVVTIMPKTQARSTRHEWVEDDLQLVQSRHGVSEGNDFSQQAFGGGVIGRRRRSNFSQHYRYEVSVSNLQRMMNPFGVNDEYAYQVGKATKQIAKDVEARLLEDTVIISASTFQGTETTVALMKNLPELLTGEPGVNGTVATQIFDSGSLTNAVLTAADIWNGAAGQTPANNILLTETILNTVLQQLTGGGAGQGIAAGQGNADRGGAHVDTIICAPSVFGTFGTFGPKTSGSFGALTMALDATQKKIVRAIRWYDSQFGLLEVIMTRWCPQARSATFTRGADPATQFAITGGVIAPAPADAGATRDDGIMYLVERNRFRLAFLRPFRHVPLPPNGDSTRGMVLGDVTCELLSHKSGGMVYGLL